MKRETVGRIFGASVLAALLISGLSAADALAGGLKKRVAVFNFEDKTDRSFNWGGHYQDTGDGMADMLTTALVKTGRYIVIERSELQSVMAEQALGASGAVTSESAAQIGQLLGADVAIFGTVSEFGYSQSSQKVGFGGIGVGRKTTKAVVGLDVRLVDTATGEILDADSIRKDESKSGLSIDTRKVQFGNQSQFDESLVGKATRKAIDGVVDLLDAKAEQVSWKAKVVTMNAGEVFINAGANFGVQVGDRFVVTRPGEELVDPDTGISLGSVEKDIGEIEVTDNTVGDGKASKCKPITGSDYQRGDVVRQKD